MLTEEDRRFLDGPRLGMLTVDPDPGEWPVPVPVWFECTGSSVQLFSLASSPKLRGIERTAYASLVAVNHLHEGERWVSVAGPVSVEATGAFELAARLAGRYWDLSDPARAATLESWKQAADAFVRIVISAEQVRRYGS